MTHHKTTETALVKNGREEPSTAIVVADHFTAVETARAFLERADQVAMALDKEATELKSRLTEIEALRKRLPAPAAPEGEHHPRAPRLQKGSLPEQVMDLLSRNPQGMSGFDISQAMREPSGRIYPMLYRYAKEGVIKKSGPKGRQLYRLATGKPVRGHN